MSTEEKMMDSEESKNIRDALALVIEAIRSLSERSPAEKGATPLLKLTKTWGLLDEACEKLGLSTRGRPT